VYRGTQRRSRSGEKPSVVSLSAEACYVAFEIERIVPACSFHALTVTTAATMSAEADVPIALMKRKPLVLQEVETESTFDDIPIM
jgi:hypothetical protein